MFRELERGMRRSCWFPQINNVPLLSFQIEMNELNRLRKVQWLILLLA
jgi:hypothetical protein